MNTSPAPQPRAHRRKVLNIAPIEFGTGVRAALERRGEVERAPLRYLFLFALNWDGDSPRSAGAAKLSRLALAS